MKRWKERHCIISIVFNWHSTSVFSTEFNTELNTICTVRDSTIRLTTRLTIQSTTRLNLDWLFSLDNSTDGLTIWLAIQLFNSADNSAYNSYFQFRLTNSYLQIQLTIGLTILVDQNGWNDPSVRAVTLPWYKAGVSCRGLPWRTLAESDTRMGRVTRGKDSFWWYFSVDRFPIMDLSTGPTPATLNRNCWCRWFYTYSRRFTHVYLRVRVYLRAMHFYSKDYFANFLRLKVFISKVSCFYLLYIIRI